MVTGHNADNVAKVLIDGPATNAKFPPSGVVSTMMWCTDGALPAKVYSHIRYQPNEGDEKDVAIFDVRFTLSDSVRDLRLEGGALVRLIAGHLGGHAGPGSTRTPITLAHLTIEPGRNVIEIRSGDMHKGHALRAFVAEQEATGVIFGSFPAWRASRLDPRRE